MRIPDYKQERVMQHWKFKRMSRKIPLRLVAEFSGYSLQYLKNIESGKDAISNAVVRAYKKTINIIDKNTKKDVVYEKRCEK